MKILYQSNDKFPPFRVDVEELFGNQMVARGHTVDWLLQSREECEEDHEQAWRGCTAFVGKTNNGGSLRERLLKHFHGIRHDLRIFGIGKRRDYDYYLVKDKFIAAVFAVLAAKLHKRKFVYWISYPYPEASIYDAKIGVARFPALYYIRGHFFDFLLYRIISKGASHIFVQSEQMKKDFMARGVPGEKMTPVPMGFSMRAYQEWQKSSPDKDTYGEVEIAYLGTLVGTRHMDFMVRVLEKVREQIPSARLLFVGDGETEADRKIIENEAERLGLSEAVIITGFMPQIEALRLIQAAKVCVSPFYPTPVLLSTSPTKLIEYMALGKAVVANDHPEQSEVIAASGGGVSVPWDEQAFADAIVGLVNNKTLREEMGQKGLAFVKAHRTYDTIVDPVERRLEQTLSE